MTNIEVMDEILKAFGLADAQYEPFGTGLINNTWKVYTPQQNFILQRINDHVFRQPQDIAHNIRLVANYLKEKHPDYFFVAPIITADSKDIVFFKGQGWFRMMPFVENSFTLDVVQTSDQAFEAAKQFGRFTKMLSGFDALKLKKTIPQFHDLELRYQQFSNATTQGNEKRINESKNIIEELIQHRSIVDEYRSILSNPQFRLRVTHHDTKISNVLFDKSSKGMCVIDLDTIMPGYFISDAGDMMRTYLSPVSEEEKDFDKIIIRNDFLQAVVEGYNEEMQNELTADEKKCFLFAGKFMIYMQALRFLTDYLNNDIYYGAKYEDHNLVRAKNQLTLLQRLIEIKSSPN
jgi:Ser/Thr protein kinase RdoA (MazF antagonist)